jgi:hypothetical protein
MKSNHEYGSVLAYFACGSITDIPAFGYEPYDTVVLVDRMLDLKKIDQHPNLSEFLSGRFILLETDAIAAVDILQWMGIRLDAYMAWNEGLWNGGGDYHLNGRFFLKYLSQILGDQYWHVHNEHYYRMRQKKNGQPTIPFIRSSAGESVNDDLSSIAEMFDKVGHYNARNHMIRLMKRDRLLPSHTNADHTFIRGNLWDIKDLDMLFIPQKYFPSKYVIMREPDPNGYGYLLPKKSQHARLPHLYNIIPEQFRHSLMEKELMAKYMKRYALDEEGINDRVIREVANAPRGSRIGFMGGSHGDWDGLWKVANKKSSIINVFEM